MILDFNPFLVGECQKHLVHKSKHTIIIDRLGEKNPTKFPTFRSSAVFGFNVIKKGLHLFLISKGLLLCSKKKTLWVESRDLSQSDTFLIIVSSFPKLNDGQQNLFFCLSTTEAWTFCKMNPLNPQIYFRQKDWEKCLLFNHRNDCLLTEQIHKMTTIFIQNSPWMSF